VRAVTKERILIVDDTMDTVELLRKRFRAEGYDTDEAYDGEAALVKVAEYRPDLVILDVMMPKLDGISVCRQLRIDPATRHLPVLMLTAKSEVPDKVEGLDTGADDYITKPFDYKELSARVRSLLSKKIASAELAKKEKTQALDQMVDEVSHEVRNPLVSIGGFARRVIKHMAADDPNRPYMEIILKNVATLERMVNELIELKGASVAFHEPIDLHDLIRTTIDQFAEEIHARNVTVQLDLMENPPRIAADRQNFGRALFNLIENSLEAMTGPERKLTVATEVTSDDFFVIRISDSGCGIGQDKIKNIYDPFFTSKTYGPGLGLTFVFRTVQNHNGMITVASEEGQGTTFTIRLPIRAGQ